MVKKDDKLVASGEQGLKRLDDLFRGVLSVSNKTVRERMDEERRKRARKRRKSKR